MKIFYLVAGIPGSGKSTLSQKLAKEKNAVICSFDNLPGAGTKAVMDGSVTKLWLQNIRFNLEQGNIVIGDNLNLTKESRKKVLDFISDIDCKKILYIKSVPLETCLARNSSRENRLPDFVLKQASRMYEEPSFDEGWDEILLDSN